MSQRVIFVVLVVGSVIACGSDPPPAPASPASAAPDPATSAQTAPQTGGSPQVDLVACLGHLDPKATDACKSCVATSCADPVRTVASACPDFGKCVCDGRPFMECAPALLAPGCGNAGMGVGMCIHQSCAAQCPSHGPGASPTATTPGVSPGANPGAAGGDACAALSACCAQIPGGAPPSCAQLVGTNNAQACGALLTAFRNMNKCR